MECGCRVTSLGKSVFFWTQQVFSYGYGKELRDKNLLNLDQWILKINEFFETNEKRDVIGLIAIHVDDLSISGSETFIRYITQRMKENSRRIAMRKMKRPTSE